MYVCIREIEFKTNSVLQLVFNRYNIIHNMILVQIRGKDCVALEAITKFATAIIQNIIPERERIKKDQFLKDQFQCTRSPMMFSVRK